jgi:hypothetical protein
LFSVDNAGTSSQHFLRAQFGQCFGIAMSK